MPLVLNNCHIDYANSLIGNMGQFNAGDYLVRKGTNPLQLATDSFHNNALGVDYDYLEFIVRPDDGYMIRSADFVDRTKLYYENSVGLNPNLVDPSLWLIDISEDENPQYANIISIGNEYDDMDPDTTDGNGWTPYRAVKIRYKLNTDYIINSSDNEFVIDFGNDDFLPANHRQVCVAVVEDITSMIDACDGCGKNYPIRIKNVIPGEGVKYMNQWNQEDIDSAQQFGGLNDDVASFQVGARFNLPLYGPENITYNNDHTVYWNGASTDTIVNPQSGVNAVDYVHYFTCITNAASAVTRHIATFEIEIVQTHHDSESFSGFINASNYGTNVTQTPTQVVTETGQGYFYFNKISGVEGRHIFIHQPPQHTVDKILSNYPNCYDIQTISYVDTNGNEQTAVTGFKFDIYWDEPDVGTDIPNSTYQTNYVPFGYVEFDEIDSQFTTTTMAAGPIVATNVINPHLYVSLNPFTYTHANWNTGINYEGTNFGGDFSNYADGFNLGTLDMANFLGGDISVLGQYGFIYNNGVNFGSSTLLSYDNFDQFRAGWYLGTKNRLVNASDYLSGLGDNNPLYNAGESIGSGISGAYRHPYIGGGGANHPQAYYHHKVFPARDAEVLGAYNYSNWNHLLDRQQVVQYPWVHPDYTIHIISEPRSTHGVITTITNQSNGGAAEAKSAPSFTTALKPTSKFKIKRVDIDSKKVHGTNAYNIIPAKGVLRNNLGPLVKILGTPGARFKVSLIESKNLEIIDLGGGIEGERSAGYNSGSGVELEGGVIPLMPEGIITIPRSGMYKFNLPYIEALTSADGWKEFDFKVLAESDSTILKSAARNKDAEILLNDVEIVDGVNASSPFDGNTLAIKMYQYPNVSVKLTATKDAGWDYTAAAYNIDNVTEVGKSKTKRDGTPLGKVDQVVKVEIRLKKLNSTFTLNKLNTTEVIDPNDGTTVVAYKINNDVIKAKVENNKDNVTFDLYAHLGQGVGSSNVNGDYVTVHGTMSVRSYGLRPQEYDIDLTEVFNNNATP